MENVVNQTADGNRSLPLYFVPYNGSQWIPSTGRLPAFSKTSCCSVEVHYVGIGMTWMSTICVDIFSINTLHCSSKHTHTHTFVSLSCGLAQTHIMDVDFTPKYLTLVAQSDKGLV